MSEQLKVVDKRMEAMEKESSDVKPCGPSAPSTMWSDGFKSYELRGLSGPFHLNKLGKTMLTQSAPSLKRHALSASKSLPVLPPIS